MSSAISEALNRHVDGAVALHVPPVGSLRRAAFVPVVRSIDEAKRQITFVASTESVDRYGDVLRVNGWDLANYKKNPIFLWAHRSQDPPIGKCVNISTETSPPALVQTIEFADANTYPFADTIFKLYRGGFLRSVSVGFRPTAQPAPITDDNGTSTGGLEFKAQELMELSAVPLPANTDAIARAISDGIVTRADADRFFKSAEPADEEDVESLQSLLLQSSVQIVKLELLRLEAIAFLYSIEKGRGDGRPKAGSREITTIEDLLSPERSITSLDQLDQALRGDR